MIDPGNFLVERNSLTFVMTHDGVLGFGRDYVCDLECELHSYTDVAERQYITQKFFSIPGELLEEKLHTIGKSTLYRYMPNIVRPTFMVADLVNQDYNLEIFYDVTDVGHLTLESLISKKREYKQKFSNEEIVSFFWEVADVLFLTCRKATEFLEVTPSNIFYKIAKHFGYKYFVANFGINYSGTKWEKKYYNPEDVYHKNDDKNEDSAAKASIFTFGLILLEMMTMAPQEDLYKNT